MIKRLVLILTIIIMVLAAGFCALHLAREYTKIYKITHIGDMWSFIRLASVTSYAPFWEIDLDDFPHSPYPVQGDLLVAVEGRPATEENYFNTFSTDTPAGKTIEIMFMHENVMYTTDIVTRTIPGPLKFQIWLMFILRTLIVLGLILTGIWGFSKNYSSSAVRTLTLFCFTLAVLMALSSDIIANPYAAFQPPVWLVAGFAILGMSSPCFWLKLHLLFPKRNTIYDRFSIPFNIAIFLPFLVLSYIRISSFPFFPVLAVTLYSTIYIAAGFILLIRNYRRSDSFIEKRQTRLVLLGSVTGVTIFILFNWFTYLFDGPNIQIPIQTLMLIYNITFLFLLPIPISFIYAFRKYKLLAVEGKIKRGTRFIAVNFVLLLIFFGLLYLFGEFVLEAVGISSQTPTLVLGLGLALVFMPTQRRLRAKVEKYFYPERGRLRNLLKDFLASSMVRTDDSSFWKNLQDKLAAGLSAENIYPVLRISDENGFVAENDEPTPFNLSDELIERLVSRENSILLDEAIESGNISLNDEQKEWFLRRKCAVILPLTVKSGLVGFLVISSKTNGEDFTSEELELLSSFSAQIALVAENIQLLRERIIKQKLDEQMRMSREIQMGFLPERIPNVKGLEIDALIRFCLEVAGDYYDVMTIPGGRVIVAVGDVAGKGVGAALLMANLQASLRTTREMGVTLAESAEKINSLIFDNTPPELFITFFMASLDPAAGRINFVNAGHNPPLLMRSDGSVERLSEGGLLFGVVRNAEYTEGIIDFRIGDTLLMYTDGVCEAMNAEEEEYGEDRIISIVSENRGVNPGKLLRLIEKSVEEFHGSSKFSDDFTLLAVRCTEKL
ncbi:MAG: SpoIIE family protein phosphatase [Candidatus Aegiribacteria sp.]|nr:SpoIIE family protein phosphatase [Candidatus Aegiribacteria sp.]